MNGAAVHRAPRPRDKQPPPWRTRQYARAVSTMIGHDRRLVPNCTRLALEIVALAGRRGFVEITRARLGARLGLSGRSITRLLGDLIRHGYVAAERTKTRTGSDAGLRLIVLDPLKPYYDLVKAGSPGESNKTRSSKNRKNGGWQAASDFAHHAPRDPPDRGKG